MIRQPAALAVIYSRISHDPKSGIMVLAAPVLVRFLVRRHARLTRPGT